LKVAKPNVVL